MCGMCGLLGNTRHWSNQSAQQDQHLSRRQRLIQINMANRILKLWRLTLSDFHGQYFVLANATGTQMVLTDFAQVWQTCEDMLKQAIDPLTIFQEKQYD